jgi:ABC-type uncharacterized transport system permease subunit
MAQADSTSLKVSFNTIMTKAATAACNPMMISAGLLPKAAMVAGVVTGDRAGCSAGPLNTRGTIAAMAAMAPATHTIA